jgi:hypothetical protein
MTKINQHQTLDVDSTIALDVKIRVTVGDLIEIINTAYEQDVIGYWECDYGQAKQADVTINGFTHNYTYKFELDYEGETMDVDVNVVKRGIERILNGDVKIAGRIEQDIRDNVASGELPAVDTEAVDCILQAGLFLDIVFG